jgi:inosine-uridine nucleoside N-ribohydrolase
MLALVGPLFDAICAAIAIDSSIITKSMEVNATVDIEGKLTRGSLVTEWPDINKDHDKLLLQGKSVKKHTEIVLDINHEKYFKIVRNAFQYFK